MAVTERVAGREHFPNYPKGFVVLRILQLIFAVILLGLCGYIVSIIIYVGAALMIFTVFKPSFSLALPIMPVRY
jgi:hypothetical protein